MTDRQNKLLNRLDYHIQSCFLCDLHKNGRAKPYWNENIKYGIIAEAPGKRETEQNTPLCGPAGTNFFNILSEYNLKRENFLIINSVNCRPVVNNKNGKPTPEQSNICSGWIRKYLKVSNVNNILLLGDYAIKSIENQLKIDLMIDNSVIRTSGVSYRKNFFGKELRFVCGVHPAWATIYNIEKGKTYINNFIIELIKPDIKKFRGKYGFLSNFHESPIVWKNEKYTTAEHAFQAAKAETEKERSMIQSANSPSEAKKMGNKIKLRHDWNNIKNSIMTEILKIKFESDQLKKQLKNTGTVLLEEGNTWHDNYWGVCNCGSCSNGQNNLGKILMNIRDKIV